MKLVEGQIIHRRYRLDTQIAHGGMGEVWKAWDTVLHRTVAVKVLRSDVLADHQHLERLRMEAHNSADLAHPNIAALFDYYEEDDAGFIVMEYVPNESLAQIYKREGRMEPGRLLAILSQVARGLYVAHERGVIHRDVKPANIMVAPNGQVKITDFGVSYSTNQAPITAAGMVVGTAQYISPEQAQGKKATPQSDIYSLGVVAYEGLAGHRPFTGATPVDIAAAQVNDPVPPLPADVDPQLGAYVMRMLAKDPAQRPRTALEVSHTFSLIEKRLIEQKSADSSQASAQVADSSHAAGFSQPYAPALVSSSSSAPAPAPAHVLTSTPAASASAAPSAVPPVPLQQTPYQSQPNAPRPVRGRHALGAHSAGSASASASSPTDHAGWIDRLGRADKFDRFDQSNRLNQTSSHVSSESSLSQTAPLDGPHRVPRVVRSMPRRASSTPIMPGDSMTSPRVSSSAPLSSTDGPQHAPERLQRHTQSHTFTDRSAEHVTGRSPLLSHLGHALSDAVRHFGENLREDFREEMAVPPLDELDEPHPLGQTPFIGRPDPTGKAQADAARTDHQDSTGTSGDAAGMNHPDTRNHQDSQDHADSHQSAPNGSENLNNTLSDSQWQPGTKADRFVRRNEEDPDE